MRYLAYTPSLQDLVQPEQRKKSLTIQSQFVWPKHRAYIVPSFSPSGFYLEKLEFLKQIFQNSYSWYWVWTVSTNASFGIIACWFRGRFCSDTRVIFNLHNILLVLILNSIHYANFGISVCGFRGEIYSLARVCPKLHDPCEIVEKIWKSQTSPRLLLWIYCMLRLQYADPSKFIVFKVHCEGGKKLQQINFILWTGKGTTTLTFVFAKCKESQIHKNWI